MEPSWFARVASYLVELEQVADKIDQALQSTRIETGDYKVEDAKAHHGRLMESLGLLEAKIAEREELLKASDAPTTGVTLTDKIKDSALPGSRALTARCQAVSQRISTVNQRAISVFVCQFHLSQVTSDIVRLLAGQTLKATYHAPNQSQGRGEPGGGLFNEAA